MYAERSHSGSLLPSTEETGVKTMNFKPNSTELDRLMRQVRRLDKKPYQLMREAFQAYMTELELQEAKELNNDEQQATN